MESINTLEKIKEIMAEILVTDDRLLLKSCTEWSLKEKETQALLILHIAEIGRRKLHLDLGFKSLFEYCQKKLNLSESEAFLRTQVAGASARIPELIAELAAGTISLTVAAKLSPHLSAKNRGELLSACRGKSKRQVDQYLADLMPKPPVDSSLRRKPQEYDEEGTPAFDFEFDEAEPKPARPSTAKLAPLGAELHHLRCTISEATKANLLRLAEILGIDNPFSQLEVLIEKAAEIAIKAKDPAKKEAQVQTKKKIVKKPKSSGNKTSKKREYISKAIREAVFLRAGYCCEYLSSEGQRCTQRTHLEIDHKQPLFLGGSNNILNLQILCSAHNKRKNEHEFGRPWVA